MMEWIKTALRLFCALGALSPALAQTATSAQTKQGPLNRPPAGLLRVYPVRATESPEGQTDGNWLVANLIDGHYGTGLGYPDQQWMAQHIGEPGKDVWCQVDLAAPSRLACIGLKSTQMRGKFCSIKDLRVEFSDDTSESFRLDINEDEPLTKGRANMQYFAFSPRTASWVRIHLLSHYNEITEGTNHGRGGFAELELYVVVAPFAVAVDGDARESSWQSASTGMLSGPRCKAWGKWWVGSDVSALYFAAMIQESDVRGTHMERGAPVWGDDHVQVHVDNRYVFSFSPAGGQVSLPAGQSVQSAVKVIGTLNYPGDRDRGWSVEARIPWGAIGREERPASFAFNVAFQKGAHDPYNPFSDGWMNWNHAYWMWLSGSRISLGASPQETDEQLARVEQILLTAARDGRRMTRAVDLLWRGRQAAFSRRYDRAWVLAAEACGAALTAPRPTVRLDTDGNGKPDVLRTMWRERYVTWIDDDGDLKPSDAIGDWEGDFMLVDSDGDGAYDNSAAGKTLWLSGRDRAMDFWLQWVDLDRDGRWDILRHHVLKWPGFDRSMFEHHRRKHSPDNLNVMNWDTFGTAHMQDYVRTGPGWSYRTIYGRFNDLTLYIKLHPSFPHEAWYSYDPDGDGASEIRVRALDQGYAATPSRGHIDQADLSIDLENRTTMQDQLDWSVMFRFMGGPGIEVTKYLSDLPRLRGLETANKRFLSGVALESREATRRAFMPLAETYKLVVNGRWGIAVAYWNEDRDDHMPEGILGDGDWGDALGDRIETDADFSGGGRIYRSPLDGKLHLLGAERGEWKQDPGGRYFGKELVNLLWNVPYSDFFWDPRGRQEAPPAGLSLPMVTYADRDKNGYFDLMRTDSDGDGKPEREAGLLAPSARPDADIGRVASLDMPYAKLVRFCNSMVSAP